MIVTNTCFWHMFLVAGYSTIRKYLRIKVRSQTVTPSKSDTNPYHRYLWSILINLFSCTDSTAAILIDRGIWEIRVLYQLRWRIKLDYRIFQRTRCGSFHCCKQSSDGGCDTLILLVLEGRMEPFLLKLCHNYLKSCSWSLENRKTPYDPFLIIVRFVTRPFVCVLPIEI